MINDISNIPDYKTLPPGDVLAALQSLTDFQANTKLWTIGGIANESPELAGKLEISLALMAEVHVPFATSTLTAASTVGLQVYTAERRALIDELALASQALPEPLRWDAEFVTQVKALGGVEVVRYPDITLEQVTEALTQMAENEAEVLRQETLRQRAGWVNAALQTAGMQAVLSNPSKTLTETLEDFTTALTEFWGE